MRPRGYIPFIPLLFFIIWESGAVHQFFGLITPMYIVSLVSALSLLIFFSLPRLREARMAAIPIFFVVLLLRNPMPYIFLLLVLIYFFYKNETLLRAILVLSPLAIFEGLGIALDVKLLLLLTFLLFLISICFDLEEEQRIKLKPITQLLLYAPLILLLMSFSTLDPIAHEKNGKIAYDGYHHQMESALFENDSLVNSTLRYLSSVGYETSVLDRAISPNSLKGISILIIETPEREYAPEEIENIKDFVAGGGGLFVLGDHTNLMDCYLNLNPILHNFGLHLNFDYSMLWEPHFSSLAGFDSIEETGGATLKINRSDALILYALKYTTWADAGDWSAQDHAYMGDVIAERSDQYGLLPICASANYGGGRVIAIANSDSISGPSLIYNYDFVGRVMSYLNHGNSFIRDFWFRFLLALLLFIGLARARLSAARPFVFSIIIVLLLVQAQALIPAGTDPANRIALDVGHGNIEGYGDPHLYKNVFFAIFSQHYGFNPVLVKKIPADLQNYKAYVTMGPTNPFSEAEINTLRDFVNKGGSLIVFDGYHSNMGADPSNRAANSLLTAFDFKLKGGLLGEVNYFNYTTWGFHLPYATNSWIQAKPQADPLTKGVNENISLYSAVEVIGGEPVAVYNSTSVIATKKVGLGRVLVIGDHTIFRNFVRYEPVFSYPDLGLKKFIENLLVSLGGREENGI